MEIIQLTPDNISLYVTDCVAAQKHLVKPNEPVEEEPFYKTTADINNYFIGVIENDRLLGMGLLTKIVHPVRTNGYVNNIVVHPDGRGKGLFSVIMDELEAKAKEWGCTKVELTCSREEVQGMYDKRGYQEKHTKFYTKEI